MSRVDPVATDTTGGVLLQPAQEPDALTEKGDQGERSEVVKTGHATSEEHRTGSDLKAEILERTSHEREHGVGCAAEVLAESFEETADKDGSTKLESCEVKGARDEKEAGKREVEDPIEDSGEKVAGEGKGSLVDEDTGEFSKEGTREDAKEAAIDDAKDALIEEVKDNATEDAKEAATEDVKDNATEDVNANARDSTKESTKEGARGDAEGNARDDAKENAEESAGKDAKESANGGSSVDVQKRVEEHGLDAGIRHAKENAKENARNITEEIVKEHTTEDANQDANKEVQQSTNGHSKDEAHEYTGQHAKEDAEALGDGVAIQPTDQVTAAESQVHSESNHQISKHDGTKENEQQNTATNTKEEAGSTTEKEAKGMKEGAGEKPSDKTEETAKKNESNVVATAVTQAARQMRREVIEVSDVRVDRAKRPSPPRPLDGRFRQKTSPQRTGFKRSSAARTAIDHHTYYRERVVSDDDPLESLWERERNNRRREHERERLREERLELERREKLELKRRGEHEHKRREEHERREERVRREERELERRQRRRDRHKERSRGLDAPEVASSSSVQVKSPPPKSLLANVLRATDAASSGNPTPDSQREQEKPRTDLRSQVVPIPPQSASAPTSTLGVLGPRTYHYQALNQREIRLIKVLPERMSVLKTELLHQSLDDSLDYIAVSYAWGDSMDTEELFLDGAKVPVASSLYYALTAVRQKKSEVLVWVDALCIDQQNANERATQVRLMGHIYSKATSVAVWLGPEADASELAMELLQDVSDDRATPQRDKATQERIRATDTYPESAALFALFQREYWRRLWCVQEVLLAKQTMVYCGDAVFPWDVYRKAAQAFWGSDSDPHVRQGPSSFPDKDALMQLGDASLLEVMRTCRKQLSENPRDKVFGILGLLPVATQREFPVDYSQSVKTVYTDVVDYLISTTDQLDVIRESIHFPIHVNNAGLPTWCPDWSYIPQVSGLGRTLGFDASKGSKAQYKFHDKRRKLEIVGIKLDVIKFTGVAVGTFCSSQDYLMAFLHWRAILLHGLDEEAKSKHHPLHKIFCRTLCLGQVPENHVLNNDWHDICYHVFAYLTRMKFPQIALDSDLLESAKATGLIDSRRKFLQAHFGNRMMGRSFCITEHRLMGMGSGYMMAEDLVVVPFGCSTPIILRPEGRRNEYRYVGDIYIDGYMHGEAVEEWEAGHLGRNDSKYMLC